MFSLVCECIVYMCKFSRGGTLLFDLSDLPYSLLEDGTFVWLHVEAVDMGKVGRDELSQLLDVLALLFPSTLVTPAGAPRGLDMLPRQPHLLVPCPYGLRTRFHQMVSRQQTLES